jgi:hypothetical protein
MSGGGTQNAAIPDKPQLDWWLVSDLLETGKLQ